MSTNLSQWDTHAQLYDQGMGDSGDELHTFSIDPLLFSYLGDYSGKTIVDAGCGNGYLTAKLAKVARAVYGIDGSGELLSRARERCEHLSNVSFQQLNLVDPLPLDHASVDVVIANMVLQYLPQLATFSVEVHDVLKSQGQLILILSHPSHELFVRAQHLAGKTNEKFLNTGSYFQTGERTKKSLWDKAVLTYHHRTVSEYINAFTPHFKLERMDELSEDNEIPRILGLKFVK